MMTISRFFVNFSCLLLIHLTSKTPSIVLPDRRGRPSPLQNHRLPLICHFWPNLPSGFPNLPKSLE